LNPEYLQRRHHWSYTLFFSKIFGEGRGEEEDRQTTHLETGQTVILSQFFQLFLLIFSEAKTISLVFCKYLIKTENTPLTYISEATVCCREKKGKA